MGKIAFIAPSEECLAVGKRVIAECGLADKVDCYLGWLQQGVDMARNLEAEGTDVIVTRGGTAELIVKAGIQTPIVEIPITVHDLAETLLMAKKLASHNNLKVAVLAFKNMINSIDVLSKVIDIELMFCQLDTGEDIEPAVERMRQEGADIIIGGVKTIALAAARGIKTLLLISGEESYREALLQANKVSYARKLEKVRMQNFRAIVDYSVQGIIGIDGAGKVSIFNNSAERLLNLGSQQVIGRNISVVFPEIPVSSCLSEATAPSRELIKINNKRLIANIIPIDIGEAIVGAMITIEDVGKIVEMEAAIRPELYMKGLSAEYRFEDIRGASPKIMEAKRIAREYAAIDSTVLIIGASGTGKELFAQSIHNASTRCQRPFVALNCGAIPASLLESELFGYAEGAFTGANKKGKPGYFELAHGGTIFLDEIGEMDKMAQTSLLRVIQERRVMRIGGDKYLPVDVRIIAATNKNLSQLIKEGKFREDLYYRINVLPLELPALNDCPGDPLLIARHFLTVYNRRFRRNVVLGEKAKAFVCRYEWPGNIRELKNYVERLVVTANDNLVMNEAEQQAFALGAKEGRGGNFAKDTILSALTATGYNQKAAAKLLGINRSTLYRRLKSLNVEVKKVCNTCSE